MSDFEVPFTRTDFLIQLTGQGGDMRDRFLQAAEGQKETALHQTGKEYEPGELLSAMARSPDCFFFVPGYFYDAWREAGKAMEERKLPEDKETKTLTTFLGVRLVPWDREFIVAHVEFVQDDEHIVVGGA